MQINARKKYPPNGSTAIPLGLRNPVEISTAL